jgi:GNAT superfamily N-acetyltransferase
MTSRIRDGAITIRPASLEDAPRLAELSGALGYPVSAEGMAKRLEAVLARSTGVVLLAELASGVVIGWIHGVEQELLESDRRCEIVGLVVDADYRGNGTGRRLVLATEEWARARGLGQMAVRSNVVRLESHPFYERLGYRRVKTQHAYRKALPATA